MNKIENDETDDKANGTKCDFNRFLESHYHPPFSNSLRHVFQYCLCVLVDRIQKSRVLC